MHTEILLSTKIEFKPSKAFSYLVIHIGLILLLFSIRYLTFLKENYIYLYMRQSNLNI